MEERKFNGERLKNARMYNGLTLTELADRTNISKQSISLYENEKNMPDSSRVMALARELGFPFDYFFQENAIVTMTETTYFRSLSTATKKERTAQSIRLEMVAAMYEVLWNYLEFPEYVEPEVSYEGFDDLLKCDSMEAVEAMEEVAQQVRKTWNVGDGPISDLQYLLEKNGLLVTGFNTGSGRIDAFSQRILVNNNGIYLIAVDLGTKSECRIRFDMCHELGHILLHPWSEDLETLSKDEFNLREKQANMFASAFLLPQDTFGEMVAPYATDLNYYKFLKKRWNVSIVAMIYRARQLQLITGNQYQYMMRQVSKNGWRKHEPDDKTAELNESIFQGAIDCLFENHILSPKTLMREFRNNGITLYPHMIEELLHLNPGTLDVPEDKVIPLFQIKRNVGSED